MVSESSAVNAENECWAHWRVFATRVLEALITNPISRLQAVNRAAPAARLTQPYVLRLACLLREILD
jgi:hypothetical protein